MEAEIKKEREAAAAEVARQAQAAEKALSTDSKRITDKRVVSLIANG